jgi:hypothetical protein
MDSGSTGRESRSAWLRWGGSHRARGRLSDAGPSDGAHRTRARLSPDGLVSFPLGLWSFTNRSTSAGVTSRSGQRNQSGCECGRRAAESRSWRQANPATTPAARRRRPRIVSPQHVPGPDRARGVAEALPGADAVVWPVRVCRLPLELRHYNLHVSRFAELPIRSPRRGVLRTSDGAAWLLPRAQARHRAGFDQRGGSAGGVALNQVPPFAVLALKLGESLPRARLTARDGVVLAEHCSLQFVHAASSPEQPRAARPKSTRCARCAPGRPRGEADTTPGSWWLAQYMRTASRISAETPRTCACADRAICSWSSRWKLRRNDALFGFVRNRH